MGAITSGCQSKWNTINNKDETEYKKGWILKEYHPPKNMKACKKQTPAKKMSQVLLIHGFIRDYCGNHSGLNIKIEQRILLLMDHTNLSEDEMSNCMHKMNKILLKHYDEGGIEVMSRIITNYMWIGNDSDSQNIQKLQQFKISHVLNCAALDIHTSYPQDIKQCCINAEDETHFDIINAYLDESFELIEDCKKSNGRVLVHCMMGMNRSVTLVIAYLMYAHGMDLFKAVEWVAIRRGWILKNVSFRKQLVEYANKIDRLEK